MNSKKTSFPHFTLLAAGTLFLGAQTFLQAGSFVGDFNSGLPAGMATFGDGAVLGSGGYTNSGFVQLTPEAGSKNGAFCITNDLDAGTPVVSFTASFKVLIGGGQRFTYADGMSFDFAPDVPLGIGGLPENGVGSGISVTFKTYPTSGNPDPTIGALAGGVPITGSPAYVDNVRANTFIDVIVQLNPDDTLDVVYDGAYVYSKVPISYTPGVGSLFWFGARTGGSWEKHFIDNLNIVTRTNPAPYINTFAPRGRQVAASRAVDILLTDYSTQVNTNTIVLKLDGGTVSPTITQDGSGATTIHFAPASPFAASSQHSVTVTFADNASPTPQTQTFDWQFTVAESIPTDFVTVFSDGFESYAAGALDKEPLYFQGGANGPNAAPNGSGNPWFGPFGPNAQVVGTEGGVSPHGGTNMIRGNVAGDDDALWCNLAYRCHGGQPIKGNCMLDWWVYDPFTSTSLTAFKDYISFYFYNNEVFPATLDWPAPWNSQGSLYWGNGIDYTLEQSLSVGGSGYNQAGGNFDPSKYQIRLEEPRGATYGLDGWCNTTNRSAGWHHNRILMGPPHTNGTVMVYCYIDDMTTPVYSGLSTLATTGFGLIELVTAWGDTDIGYYDDVSFSLVRPPNLTSARSGNNVILTWPGEGFTLLQASDLSGPWTEVTGATSGYSYDATSGPRQFFRLKN
jgi:hypothetical protein